MRIAVTGGSGQLGTLVLRRLAADDAVTGIVSIDLRPPAIVSSKLRAVTADVRDPNFARHLEGCEGLVHLAFVVTTAPPRHVFDDININGSKNVFRAAAAAGVKRVVYSSSIAAYGVLPGLPVPVVETTPRRLQQDFAYAACKFQVEDFLDSFEPEHPDLSIARLRPAILIGGVMEHMLGDMLRRRVVVDAGPRSAPLPIVWDEDVADAAILALKAGARGAFNLAADEPLTMADLARAGGLRLLNLPGPVRTAATRARTLAGKVGLVPSTDPKWLEVTGVVLIVSSEKARRELGWSPRWPTAADVIKRYVEVAPSRPDRRILAFFRAVERASRTAAPIPDAPRFSGDLYVRLAGPGGGDFSVRADDGRLAIRQGIPRPPAGIVTLTARTFLELLNGRTDFATATRGGLLEVEGEPLAGRVLQGMFEQFRAQTTQRGFAGWSSRRLSRWFSQG